MPFVSKLFSLLAENANMLVHIYLDEKSATWRWKPLNKRCLESSFDAGFVAKSNIDAVQQKQNALSRRNNFNCKQNWTVYSSTDQEGIPLPIITESTMWIYGRANIFFEDISKACFHFILKLIFWRKSLCRKLPL